MPTPSSTTTSARAAPAPRTDSETITYDATNDAYYETGPSGVAFAYGSIAPSTYHGCTPNNPFGLLTAGSNLDDDPGTGGPTTDAVAGFQSSLGTLATGAATWVGWITVLAPDANGQARSGACAPGSTGARPTSS
jgi:hypothetical protein